MKAQRDTPWLCAILCLLLVGCDEQTKAEKVAEFERFYVLVDPVTGCQYVKGRGLTPRLDKEGKPICPK